MTLPPYDTDELAGNLHLADLFAPWHPLNDAVKSLLERSLVLPDTLLTFHDLLNLKKVNDTKTAFNLGLLLFSLSRVIHAGSVCLNETQFGDFLKGCSKYMMIQQGAPSLKSVVTQEGMRDFVGFDEKATSVLVYYNGNLYTRKDFISERSLEECLINRMAQDSIDLMNAGKMITTFQEVCLNNPARYEDGEGKMRKINFALRQQISVLLGMASKTLIVSGGPGTGKTTVVATVLRALLRLNPATGSIAMTAPTGRAAKRLSEAVHLSLNSLQEQTEEDSALGEKLHFSTLHSLLKVGSIHGMRDRHWPVPFDVVVVDEVSMVDLFLMSKLFRALKNDTRLILLGDPDQLPSVDSGQVLADLASQKALSYSERFLNLCKGVGISTEGLSEGQNRMTDRCVHLDEGHRSGMAVTRMAEHVAAKEEQAAMKCLLPDDRSGFGYDRVCLFEPKNAADFELRLQGWVDHFYLQPQKEGKASWIDLVRSFELDAEPDKDRLSRVFRLVNQGRVLCACRRGSFGMNRVNAFMAEQIRSALRVKGRHSTGTPVLITKNDHRRNLYNGDIGVILPTKRGQIIENRVFFESNDSSFIDYSLNELPPYEESFAMTIHKSQGSEFANVMIVLPDENLSEFINRKMLYTALTRTKGLALICGSQSVLRKAINHDAGRISGLQFFKD